MSRSFAPPACPTASSSSSATPPVERRGERRHLGLEALPQLPAGGDLGLDLGRRLRTGCCVRVGHRGFSPLRAGAADRGSPAGFAG
jgi:hypothetical protein